MIGLILNLYLQVVTSSGIAFPGMNLPSNGPGLGQITDCTEDEEEEIDDDEEGTLEIEKKPC